MACLGFTFADFSGLFLKLKQPFDATHCYFVGVPNRHHKAAAIMFYHPAKDSNVLTRGARLARTAARGFF